MIRFTWFVGVLCAVATAAPLAPKEVAGKLALYESIATLRSRFRQTKLLKDVNLKLDSEGELTLVRPDKVTWAIRKPARMEVSLDGRTVTLTSADKSETYTLGENPDDTVSRGLMGLIAWLRVDVNALNAAYEFTQLEGGEYLCTPRESAGAPFRAMKLKIHDAGHVEKLVLDELSGDSLTIQFDKPVLTRKK